MGKLNFPTTYREEDLVGKLPKDVRWLHPLFRNLQSSPPPIEKRCSWGSWPPNFPTTHREEGLVGKLARKGVR